ncbi:MAG TPA: acetyl-CoA carboxylase biotin carboxyl carrier protein [Alphaproteobacteria bacterium]|jgi:acetyl-CoA carboxylase biotin carboxyl carrier protein|nr:acetyl-CoA carboxylase biotin carboxyl carrier protein [Alphaproteobacteria bacterium]MDP6271394.1 acetyl-CoA carboxylase biotin carboxyl carrier protein [Alphaproteobacteria bacterium]HJM51356.1 acetyl-CoA carboxylase biotin carboxyl carrier protein [Alphaproteobacteria bacterium]
MPTTISDIKRILEIVEESAYEEVDIQFDDLRIRASKNRPLAPLAGAPPANPASPASPASPAAQVEVPPVAVPEGLFVVSAPMVGTVFRAPAPQEPPFCEVGDRVAADDTVCLIEIMKLFNSIAAGVSGTVKEILVENGALVAYDQPLILIEPD